MLIPTTLPLALRSYYDVGLAGLMYPHTWFNLDNTDGRLHFFIRLRDGQSKQHVFLSGYYPDEPVLAAALNQQISEVLTEVDHYSPIVRFSFNPSSSRMSLVHKSRGWIIFASSLLEYLGLPNWSV